MTAASGHAVLVIIIFAGEELTFLQRIVEDICVLFDDTKDVKGNTGLGRRFPGGPHYTFRGKDIEPVTAGSSSYSIKSEILHVAFQRLDDLGMYERQPNLQPFCFL